MLFTLPANLYPENNFASCAIVTKNAEELDILTQNEIPISLIKNKCILICNDTGSKLSLKITYGISNDLTSDTIVDLKANLNYKIFLPYPVLQILNIGGISPTDVTNKTLVTIFCFN